MGLALEDAEHKEGRAKLVEMTKEAMQTGLTTNQLLMERCESDFLDEIGVIAGGAAMFYKKQVLFRRKQGAISQNTANNQTNQGTIIQKQGSNSTFWTRSAS
jgi:hypothetical protein